MEVGLSPPFFVKKGGFLMTITANMVKELRERTGAGMMDCKKALAENNGDMEKAIEFLREKGLAAAAKKAGRIAAEGIVSTLVEGNVGVMVEVNCETDFVAKTEDFSELVEKTLAFIAKEKPADVESLLKASYEGATFEDFFKARIAKTGENMAVRRFVVFELNDANEGLTSYIHLNGKIGVLVKAKVDNAEAAKSDAFNDLLKDIALQIAAANPLYLDRTQVDNEKLEEERKIYRVQALQEGKPEKIVDKIVEGRLSKFYGEVCLLEQEFIKNDDMKVDAYIKSVAKELNSNITIQQFARFERGEGIEKKTDDLAAEVAAMTKS